MSQRLVMAAALGFLLSGSYAYGQCGCGAAPVATSAAPTYSAYYAAPADNYPAATYSTYYAPAATTYTAAYAPVVSSGPVAYTSYYAPAAYAPAPYTTYYAPAVPYATNYAPYAVAAPAAVPYRAYYGVPGWSAYGTPRLYVPGEPVRNALRAVTP